MAEEDLLSETVTYSLQDTGQGMQRVQQSPRTYRAMQQILLRVQAKVKNWVGSSVIHMGDHNVPNALSFIDKYTQGKRRWEGRYMLRVCMRFLSTS
jgi:NADH:ubiquinone oxidoreductase subunit E